MTAGNGIAHSEQTTKQYAGAMHAVQLWVAQPAATRFGESGFEHHEDLPQVELGNAVATVIVGAFSGGTSAARTDTPMVGVELAMRAGDVTVPLQPDFEYAIVVLDGAVQIEEQRATPGLLAYLGVGRDELTLSATDPTRMLLLGGEPFGEPVFMWWNFVARTREEVEAARFAWETVDERFSDVDWTLPRIAAPELPWVSQR
jgi:redox-sensitive bicupin YhaK (pirin superfamily)